MMHQDDPLESKQKITNGFVDSIMASSCSLNGTMNANSLSDGFDSVGGEQGCDSGGGEQDHLSSKDGSVSSKSGSPSPSPDSCSPCPNDHDQQDQYPEENKHQLTMVPGSAFFSHGERKDGDSGFISPEGNISAAGVIESGSLHSHLLRQSSDGLEEVKPTNNYLMDEEFDGKPLDNSADCEVDVLVPLLEEMNKEFNIIKDFNEPAEDDEVDNFEYKIQRNALDESTVDAECIGNIGNLDQKSVFNDELSQIERHQLEDNDKIMDMDNCYANCKQDDLINDYDPMTTSMIKLADPMTSSMMDLPIRSDKTDDKIGTSSNKDEDGKDKDIDTEEYYLQDIGCQAYDPMTISDTINSSMIDLPIKSEETVDNLSASSSEDEEDRSEKKDENEDHSNSYSSSEESEDINNRAVKIDNMREHSSTVDNKEAEKEIVNNSSYISENKDSFKSEFAEKNETCIESPKIDFSSDEQEGENYGEINCQESENYEVHKFNHPFSEEDQEVFVNYMTQSRDKHSNLDASCEEETKETNGNNTDIDSEIKNKNKQFEDADEESLAKNMVQNKIDNLDGLSSYDANSEKNEIVQFDDMDTAYLVKPVAQNLADEEEEEKVYSTKELGMETTIEIESKDDHIDESKDENSFNQKEQENDNEDIEDIEFEKQCSKEENMMVEKTEASAQSFVLNADDESYDHSISCGESEDKDDMEADMETHKENISWEQKTREDKANCGKYTEKDSSETEEPIMRIYTEEIKDNMDLSVGPVSVVENTEDQPVLDDQRQADNRLEKGFVLNSKYDNSSENEINDNELRCLLIENPTSSSHNVYPKQDLHNDEEKMKDTLSDHQSEDKVLTYECEKNTNKNFSSNDVAQMLNFSNKDEEAASSYEQEKNMMQSDVNMEASLSTNINEELDDGIMRESMVTNISEEKPSDFGFEFNDQYEPETEDITVRIQTELSERGENAQVVLSEQTSFQIETDNYFQQKDGTSVEDSCLDSQLVSKPFSSEQFIESETVLGEDQNQNQDHISTMMDSAFKNETYSEESSEMLLQSNAIIAEKSVETGKEIDYNKSYLLCDNKQECKDQETEQNEIMNMKVHSVGDNETVFNGQNETKENKAVDQVEDINGEQDHIDDETEGGLNMAGNNQTVGEINKTVNDISNVLNGQNEVKENRADDQVEDTNGEQDHIDDETEHGLNMAGNNQTFGEMNKTVNEISNVQESNEVTMNQCSKQGHKDDETEGKKDVDIISLTISDDIEIYVNETHERKENLEIDQIIINSTLNKSEPDHKEDEIYENEKCDGNALIVGDIEKSFNEPNEINFETIVDSKINKISDNINEQEHNIQNEDHCEEDNPGNLDNDSALQNTFINNKEGDNETNRIGNSENKTNTQITNGCEEKPLSFIIETKNKNSVDTTEPSKVLVEEMINTENSNSNTCDTIKEKNIVSEPALSLMEEDISNNMSELKNHKPLTEKEPEPQEGLITTKEEPNSVDTTEPSKVLVEDMIITENSNSNTFDTIKEKNIVLEPAWSLMEEKILNKRSELKNPKPLTEKEPELQEGIITTKEEPKEISAVKKNSKPTSAAKPSPRTTPSTSKSIGGSQLLTVKKSIPPAKGSTAAHTRTSANTSKPVTARPKIGVSRTTQAAAPSPPRPGTTKTSESTKNPISRPLTTKPTSGPAKTTPISRPQSAKLTSGPSKLTPISRPQTTKQTSSAPKSTPLTRPHNAMPNLGPVKTTPISRPTSAATSKAPTVARTPLSSRTTPLARPSPLPSTLRPRPTSTSRLRAASAARKAKPSAPISSSRAQTSKEKTTTAPTASSRSRATATAKPTSSTSRSTPSRLTSSSKKLISSTKTQEKTLNKTVGSKPSTLKKCASPVAEIESIDLGKSEVSVEENVLIENEENKVNGLSNGLQTITNGINGVHGEEEEVE